MIQVDLFQEKNEVIRTLGFYQPFGSLMFHGKIETRWVRVGKKPPFPLGKYLFYTTKKKCDMADLFDWCGAEIMNTIDETLKHDPGCLFNGYALGYGTLTKVRLMTKEDEPKAFVKHKGVYTEQLESGELVSKVQWCLEFENITPIEPYIFTQGKQGVGILKTQPCQ